MIFRVSTVSRNNLGNQGPNLNDPEGIMYDNVFPDSGKKINLLLKAESPYQTVAKYNGLNKENSVAKINILSGTETNLTFNFIDGESCVPVEVGPFYMAFLDFDESKREGVAREYLTIHDATSYLLTDQSLVSAVNHQNGKSVTFRSTVYGQGSDNAKNATMLTVEQMHKSVLLAFPRLSTFPATIGVAPLPGKGSHGRNVNFAGFTNMACNEDIALDVSTRPNRVEASSTFSV